MEPVYVLLLLATVPSAQSFLSPSTRFVPRSETAVLSHVSYGNTIGGTTSIAHDRGCIRVCAGRGRRRWALCMGVSKGIGDEAIEAELVFIRGLRASEIKKTLTEMEISTFGVFEKEDLARLLATEQVRRKSDPKGNKRASNASGSSSSARPSNPNPSFNDDNFDWAPPPESWTEAKWGSGGPKASRLTSEGAVVPMMRIRPSVAALGDGVSVDQKDYYCVDLELPGAPSGATRELFMLDTAATSSLLTPKASARLGAVRTGISAMGAAGTDGVTGLYQVDVGEVKLAGQSCGWLKPVVMELPITDIKAPLGMSGMEKGVSGILGMDFLQRFDVKLDFQTGEATFSNPGVAVAGSLGAGDMTEVEGKVLPNGFFVINVKMERAGGSSGPGQGSLQAIPAIVDLGSAFTIGNWAAGKAAGLTPTSPAVRYNGQVVAGAAAPGETYNPVEVGEAGMDLIIGTKAGGSSVIKGRTVMIGDLPGFKAMGMFGPMLILGSDVLKLGKGAMIISFYSRKIWLAL